MNTDPGPSAPNARIACTFHDDQRLLAGVAALIARVARRAGLPEREQAEFAAAAAEVCRETFLSGESRGAAPSSIQMAVADFPDRVEVTIESSAGAGEEVAGQFKGEGVDRLNRETRDGRARVTLVKYRDAAKSRPQV